VSNLLQLRRGITSLWASTNPVLAEGEPGFDLDTNIIKVGDGVTAWNSLNGVSLIDILSVLTFEAVATPTTPSANRLNMFAQSRAGRMFPFMQGPSGLDSPLQPALFANYVHFIGTNTTTTFTSMGGPTFTAVGTVSHPALSATVNLKEGVTRAIVTSAATANSASELRVAQTMVYRGDAAGFGGWYMRWRFGFGTAVTNQRSAVGLWGSTGATATTQSPSALTNCIFIGNDSSDANLQIMHNDGAGNCTKVDLGASFPANSTTNILDFDLFAAPNSASVGWRVANLRTGAVASGTITTDLPATTTFLAPHAYMNNGGTAAAVVLDFYRYYLEKDL